MAAALAPSLPIHSSGRRADCLHPVLLFDDGCSVCRRFVSFLISADRNDRLRIAPLHGVFGDAVRRTHTDLDARGSALFVRSDGTILSHSDAIIAALTEVGGVWRLMGHLLHAIPRGARNSAYATLDSRRSYFHRLGLTELDARAARRRLTQDQIRELVRN